jgi:hypothetical protein
MRSDRSRRCRSGPRHAARTFRGWVTSRSSFSRSAARGLRQRAGHRDRRRLQRLIPSPRAMRRTQLSSAACR